MNRREWIKSVLSAVVASQIPIDLTPAEAPPVSLYGIPYHQSNAFTGTWLGIVRSTYPQFKSTRGPECQENSLTPTEYEVDRN